MTGIIKGSKTPLRDAFHEMLGPRSALLRPGMYKALLEAFMAGAAAHDNIATEAAKKDCPEHLARVLDDMVGEMKARHDRRGLRP